MFYLPGEIWNFTGRYMSTTVFRNSRYWKITASFSVPFLYICCTGCQGYLGLHAQLRGMDRPVAWYGKKVAVSFNKQRIVLMCVDSSVTHQTINLRKTPLVSSPYIPRAVGDKLWNHLGWLSLCPGMLADLHPNNCTFPPNTQQVLLVINQLRSIELSSKPPMNPRLLTLGFNILKPSFSWDGLNGKSSVPGWRPAPRRREPPARFRTSSAPHWNRYTPPNGEHN